ERVAGQQRVGLGLGGEVELRHAPSVPEPRPRRSGELDIRVGAAATGGFWQIGGMEQLDRLLRAGSWDEAHRELARGRPFDVAEELTRLAGPQRAVAFRLLPKDLALEVFEALDAPAQGELLTELREEPVRELIAQLDPDDRVELLDELPAKVVNKLLAD